MLGVPPDRDLQFPWPWGEGGKVLKMEIAEKIRIWKKKRSKKKSKKKERKNSNLQKSCIFCDIALKKSPSIIIYEDKNYLGFLDIKPYANGHIVVIPKIHTQSLTTASDKINSEILIVISKIATMIKPKLNCDGFFFNTNDGKMAHQRINHYHWHIKPVYKGDNQSWWSRPNKKFLPLETIEKMIKSSPKILNDVKFDE